jgi:methionyl-tRNA formyltransferase
MNAIVAPTDLPLARQSQPVPANRVPPRVRVALFGSFHGGGTVLQTLLTTLADAVQVIGVATDDPTRPYTNAQVRLWKYPHTPEEEHLVTRLAEEHGLPVFTGRVRTDAFAATFTREWRPDLCLMATFGQRIPARLFEFPGLGFYNFHHSDTDWPSYPGPDPIRDLVRDGKRQVVISLHAVVEALDQGALVAQSPPVPLPAHPNAVTVHRLTWPRMTTFIEEVVRRLLQEKGGQPTAEAIRG